jgi:hypothetical protein
MKVTQSIFKIGTFITILGSSLLSVNCDAFIKHGERYLVWATWKVEEFGALELKPLEAITDSDFFLLLSKHGQVYIHGTNPQLYLQNIEPSSVVEVDIACSEYLFYNPIHNVLGYKKRKAATSMLLCRHEHGPLRWEEKEDGHDPTPNEIWTFVAEDTDEYKALQIRGYAISLRADMKEMTECNEDLDNLAQLLVSHARELIVNPTERSVVRVQEFITAIQDYKPHELTTKLRVIKQVLDGMNPRDIKVKKAMATLGETFILLAKKAKRIAINKHLFNFIDYMRQLNKKSDVPVGLSRTLEQEAGNLQDERKLVGALNNIGYSINAYNIPEDMRRFGTFLSQLTETDLEDSHTKTKIDIIIGELLKIFDLLNEMDRPQVAKKQVGFRDTIRKVIGRL